MFDSTINSSSESNLFSESFMTARWRSSDVQFKNQVLLSQFFSVNLS